MATNKKKHAFWLTPEAKTMVFGGNRRKMAASTRLLKPSFIQHQLAIQRLLF